MSSQDIGEHQELSRHTGSWRWPSAAKRGGGVLGVVTTRITVMRRLQRPYTGGPQQQQGGARSPYGEGPDLAARGENQHDASLALFAPGGVAKTLSTPTTAVFGFLPRSEKTFAIRRAGFHHGLLRCGLEPNAPSVCAA